MASTRLSTHHIDYLQRSFAPPPIQPEHTATSAAPELRRMWHVRGVGKISQIERPITPGVRPSFVMRDALIGLHGYKIPVAFHIEGSPSGVSIKIGIWSPGERERASVATLNARADIMDSVLRSIYPDVALVPSDPQTDVYPNVGIVLGQPGSQPPELMGGALPIDRLIRALFGTAWGALVLADPIDEDVLTNIRNNILNELRAVQAETQAMAAPNPLSQLYQDLLSFFLYGYTRGQAEGAWRTGVYLMGDRTNYYRLAGVWRSIFSGDESIFEPVRIFEDSHAMGLVQSWALPDVEGPAGPGSFQHPFSFQTLLTSSQLAHYIHLPKDETSGFSINLIPSFDSMPPAIGEADGLVLGNVIDRTQETETTYRLSLSMLDRHALVAGVTGGGKTNTIFHLLGQLWARRIPFLILEPAKTEYRALIDHPTIGPDLRVFTPGDENVSPLRLNPFEFELGISVATHIDLLKSVFNASFGMWNPLPHVLERCIHAVYSDCGWDSARGGNTRMEDGHQAINEVDPQAYPNLTQLYTKVEEIVDSLGYAHRVTSDIKAALMTRLNSLRIGAKGFMLDSRRSIPLSELLCQPTVIELEAIGDDNEKAFIMGILLVRIYEHLRARGAIEGTQLQHMVVIEEAHRLLANVPPSTNLEQANARGKAVETFANMLSEVRAYGEGFLVAEQIPSKLAPDVIKNTNLKVVHRVVAVDDRIALGGTMNMGEEQVGMLSTFSTGQAAVFSEGDDKPLLVQVPPAKIEAGPDMDTKHKSDARLAQWMSGFRELETVSGAYIPHVLCPSNCGQPYRYCDDAKLLIEVEQFRLQFSGLVLTALLDEESLPARLSDLLGTMRARLPKRSIGPGAYSCVLLNALEWYVSRFGRNYHWPYSFCRWLQGELSTALVATLSAALGSTTGASPRLETIAKTYRQACLRAEDPFWACSEVCPSGECLFRYHNQMLMADEPLEEAFNEALDGSGSERIWSDLGPIDGVIARFNAEGYSPEDRRSLGLCYGVQRIAVKSGWLESARKLAVIDLIEGFDAANEE